MQAVGTCTSPPAGNGPLIELWRGPRVENGRTYAADGAGSQWAELNAEQASRIYQSICMTNGEQFTWRYSHRSRNLALGGDPQSLRFGISTLADDLPNELLVSTSSVAKSNANWVLRTGTYTYTGPTGVQTIGFRATSTGTIGNFLDNIQINLTPYIDLSSITGAASGLESVPIASLPKLRASGTLTAALTVSVTVTPLTATLGTDFTTPGNATTFNVTIPAGDYDGTQLIDLGINIVNDAIIEQDETFRVAINAGGTNYTVASSQSCGGSASTPTTYTILDDDASVSVQKTTVGGAGGPFTFAQSGLASTPTAITTTAANTVTPATGVPIAAVAGTPVTVTETVATGFAQTGAVCTDTNSSATPNATAQPTITVTGSGPVTIPAANVVARATYACVFTNARLPTVQIRKQALGGTGTFTFAGDATNGNGFGTDSINVATAGATVSGAVKTLTAASTLTTIGENTPPAGFTLTGISCTGTGTGNTNTNLTARTVTLNALATAPGNVVQCTFTNTKIPTVSVQKTTTAALVARSPSRRQALPVRQRIFQQQL